MYGRRTGQRNSGSLSTCVTPAMKSEEEVSTSTEIFPPDDSALPKLMSFSSSQSSSPSSEFLVGAALDQVEGGSALSDTDD